MTRHAHGMVLGKFWPLHAGHQHLIEEALARCDRVTVQLFARRDEDVPLEVRAGWIRELYPEVRLVAEHDETPVDFEDPAVWDLHMALIRSHLDTPVDVVLSSDEYGRELARRLDAVWVQVDPGRREVPVSGTAVRADPGAHWQLLAPPVRAWYVRRVIVTGAESTGTTTLAAALADRLGCPWVAEYGRTWSEIRPGGLAAPWRTEEFVQIVEEQLRQEDAAARSTPVPWLVGDTDALATTLWHERYVGHLSPEVAHAASAQRTPYLRVLTGDEIRWVDDGMRDGEHLRHAMQDRFRETLAEVERATGAGWLEVRGSVSERVASVDRCLHERRQ